MTIRAGLIGYGLGGRYLHAPFLTAAGFDLRAVVTSRAEALAVEHPSAGALGSAEALIARPDIDLVVVVSPDHLHAAHVRLALEAGKHVVVDKPFTQTSAEGLALAHMAEAKGVMLSVYQNRRWDSDFRTLQTLIGDGALGEIVHYSARWDRYRPAARGSWHDAHMQGELWGLGPHLIDQVLVLFGAPDWLMADVYNQRGVAPHDDGFEIIMGKGRARITIGVNFLSHDSERSLRVRGAGGAFSVTGLDVQEKQLKDGASPLAAGFGGPPEPLWGKLTRADIAASETVPALPGRWLSFYEGLREAIEKNGQPPVTAREGARVIAMLEAVRESAETGRRVDVPAFLHAKGF